MMLKSREKIAYATISLTLFIIILMLESTSFTVNASSVEISVSPSSPLPGQLVKIHVTGLTPNADVGVEVWCGSKLIWIEEFKAGSTGVLDTIFKVPPSAPGGSVIKIYVAERTKGSSYANVYVKTVVVGYPHTITTTPPPPPPVITTTTTATTTTTVPRILPVPVVIVAPGKYIVNLSTVIGVKGAVKTSVSISIPSEKIILKINAGTKILLKGKPVATLVVEIARIPPPPPPNGVVVGPVIDFGPSGVTFSKPVRIGIPMNTSKIPAGTPPEYIKIAYYDKARGEWIPIETDYINFQQGIAFGWTTHFTKFAVIATKPPVTTTTSSSTTTTTTATTTKTTVTTSTRTTTPPTTTTTTTSSTTSTPLVTTTSTTTTTTPLTSSPATSTPAKPPVWHKVLISVIVAVIIIVAVAVATRKKG